MAAYPRSERRRRSWGPVRAEPAVLEVEHPFGQPDRRQPVGDDDQRRVELATERVRDLRLDRWIDRARRVIQDEDPRLPHERASDRDPLPLTARERVTALPDHGRVAAGEPLDEPCRVRDRGGALDLLGVRAGVERDVLADRRREQEALLEDDRCRAPERAEDPRPGGRPHPSSPSPRSDRRDERAAGRASTCRHPSSRRWPPSRRPARRTTRLRGPASRRPHTTGSRPRLRADRPEAPRAIPAAERGRDVPGLPRSDRGPPPHGAAGPGSSR